MGLPPRPFTFAITREEAAHITPPPAGRGGFQQLQEQLGEPIEGGDFLIHLNDEELGRIVRYMTQYRAGGFQSRLRQAFLRSLLDQLG